MGTRVAAAGTPIRRYVLALTPAGAGIEAAVAAASVPPLGGGTGSHGSEAAHAFTVAGMCVSSVELGSASAGVSHVTARPVRGSAGTTAPPEEITLPLPGVTVTVVYMTHSPSITGRESWQQPRYAMLGMLPSKGASV